MRRVRGQRGLTLLEVMISMAILAAMLVVIYATMKDSRKTFAYVDKMQNRWHVIRQGMHRITRDLQSAYVSVNQNMAAVERRTFFRLMKGNHGEELRFSSFNRRRLVANADESDQCVIQYYVDDDPDNPSIRSLFRRETRRQGEEKVEDLPGEAYVVIPDVVDVRYEFFDQTQDKWVESWDTTTLDGQPNRVPNLVRIYLTVNNSKDKEVTLVTMAQPMMVDGLNFTPLPPTGSQPGGRTGSGRRGTGGVKLGTGRQGLGRSMTGTRR